MRLRGDETLAVLAGGPSCEREISLLSGRAVWKALTGRGFRAFLLDPMDGFLSVLKKENVRAAFLALHGAFGEDGTVQRLLEGEGIPYTGPGVEASERAFDKVRAQRLFGERGILVPPHFVLRKDGPLPRSGEGSFSLPWVVKPARGGSSMGVSIASDEEGYREACRKAFSYSDVLLVEKYIEGRELTVGILGDEALPVVEIVPKREFYDTEAKYQDSGTVYKVPAPLEPFQAEKLQETALGAYRALGCEAVSRVDILLGPSGDFYVLEVNTLPGLTEKSLLPKAAWAAGIDFPELCVRIIELSLGRIRGDCLMQKS
ncbi:MAG: D-alanine--D-alanine ligase [Candidatus Omnitrophica bacterium]|nr:D-alanine--D-alanine ligase [Candidatus Omnitrophota bacterium]